VINWLAKKKKNKCGRCKAEDCSQAGDEFVAYFDCVSFKAKKGDLNEWQQKEEDEKKRKEEEQRKYGRGGGSVWDFAPDDYDYDYDDEDFETQTMDPDDFDF
jgi:hypothetical protein